MATQLAFHDVKFNLVHHNNQIWFTSAELSTALKYSNVRAVSGIYNRHKNEFTDRMSLVLKLNTKGFGGGNSAKDTRVFSLRGAHLIGMMSDTPVAKEFRRWVLDILDREVGSPEMLPANNTQNSPTAYDNGRLLDLAMIAWGAHREMDVVLNCFNQRKPGWDSEVFWRLMTIRSDVTELGWGMVKLAGFPK